MLWWSLILLVAIAKFFPRRYVVATRDIKPGEIILKEKPIIIGPKQKSTLLCLGCHKPSVDTKCPRCWYPLCNATCQKYHKVEPHQKTAFKLYFLNIQRNISFTKEIYLHDLSNKEMKLNFKKSRLRRSWSVHFFTNSHFLLVGLVCIE